MTVLNDKLIAQREGNDHAGKESKDIQNQTMVPPDSRVGMTMDIVPVKRPVIYA